MVDRRKPASGASVPEPATPAQYALKYGGEPLPPPSKRLTPLTRRAAPSESGAPADSGAKAVPAAPSARPKPAPPPVVAARPAPPAKSVVSAPTALPGPPAPVVRLNPLQRRGLPSVAVISKAEPPPQTRATPAEPAPVEVVAPVAPPVQSPAAVGLLTGAPSAIPGAALAFLSAEQRARVIAATRSAPPEPAEPVVLPAAAAAMAALARRPLASAVTAPPAVPPVAPAPVPAQPAAAEPETTSAPMAAEPVLVPEIVDSGSVTPPALAEAGDQVSSPFAKALVAQPGPHNGHKPVISVRGITKVYTMGDVEVHALQGVDLDIYPGEMTAIMGPSGSGKSTLMNIIGCLDVPTAGTYLLDGEDVSRMKDDELADVRGRKIGFVFQSFNLLSRTSALANVELPLLYSGSGTVSRHSRARAVLDLVGLGSRMHHKPNELSGGQQQRVAIARALINEPAMILADEPTGNLDSKTSVEIMELFQRLNQERGITIIFVTHNIETADYCHRVVHVRDGHVERDVRHQPKAGIYRDLLPEDLPLEALRITAVEDAHSTHAPAAPAEIGAEERA